ncbi:MAG: hypothetical protein K6G73_06135 [Marinilabiliaceae bacterium]|nr:hypothetical protein [Marinilabiliaceae bacterium]
MDNNIKNVVSQWSDVISNRKDASKIFLNIALSVLGVLIAVMSLMSRSLNSITALCCLAVGATIFGFGLWLIYNHSSVLCYTPTGSRIRHYKRYVNRNEWSKVASELGLEPSLPFVGNGELMVDTLTSDDGKFNVYMVSQFIEFEYKVIFGPAEK